MPYEKKTIAPLQGLITSPRPDLIQDTQASDMLNLRFDMLGYLVNRNGVRAFEVDTTYTAQLPSVGKIAGATAIGEFVLSHFITDSVDYEYNPILTPKVIETLTNDQYYGAALSLNQYDRFMVYGLRTYRSEPLPGNVNAGQSNPLIYCLIPLSEMPETRAEWNHKYNVNNTGKKMCVFFIAPTNQDGTSGNILYAPARRLSRSADDKWVDATTGFIDDENWIDHYEQMAQLKHRLVIADRVNGDLVIVNKYDEAEPGETKDDVIQMRYNCQSLFDIDIVRPDYLLGAAEKNGLGAETGLALYKFYADRRETVEPYDGHNSDTGNLVGKSIAPTKSDIVAMKGMVIDDETQSWDFGKPVKEIINSTGVFLRGYLGVVFDADRPGWAAVPWKLLQVDKGTSYVYSNMQEKTTYNSLLHKVSFTNEDMPVEYNDDGSIKNNNSSDVFIWEGVRMKYFPSYGREQGKRLLTGYDRLWSKSIPVVPKTTKITTKVGVEQHVPIASWAYRFTWDLGNGEFTSPSATLLVGDIMWSAVPDDSMTIYDPSIGVHPERFMSFAGSGAEHSAHGMTSNAGRFSPYLADSGDTVTNKVYTTGFSTIKDALYDASHIFNEPPDLKRHQVLITVFNQGDTVQCKGVFGQIVEHHYKGNSDHSITSGLGSSGVVNFNDSKVSNVVSLKVSVVLNRNTFDTATLQSLFTETDASPSSGVFRACLDNELAPKNASGVTTPPYQSPPPGTVSYNIVFPGVNATPGMFSTLATPGTTDYLNALLLRQSGSVNASRFAQNTYALIPFIGGAVQSNMTFSGFTDGGGYPGGMAIAYNGRDLLLNFVRNNAEDTNNTAQPSKSTLLRLTQQQNHRLLNFKEGIPPEVKDRLLLQGMAELKACDYGQSGVCLTEKSFGLDDRGLDKDKERTWTILSDGKINSSTLVYPTNETDIVNHIMPMVDDYNLIYTHSEDSNNEFAAGARYYKNTYQLPATDNRWIEDYTFANVTVAIYLSGERLLIPEQLTAYFPSSLLFKAPRINLNIRSADIPPRAKRLIIFRTMASIDNAWQPDQFGHVEDVVVKRDNAGVPEDIEYFDEIKDDKLDFTHIPEEYDAIINPLQSRFARPLANVMWFAHFTETYQPYPVRGVVAMDGDESALPDLNTDSPATTYVGSPVKIRTSCIKPKILAPADKLYIYAGTNLNGFITAYFLVQKDLTGQYSPLKTTDDYTISFVGVSAPNRGIVMISMAGYPYTAAIEKFEVYRRRDNNASPNPTFYKIGEIEPEDEGLFVDDGTISDGEAWTTYDILGNPSSEPLIEERISDIAWSELGQPSKILYTSRQPINHGDGDMITGMEINYGEIIVFKERSVHRVTLKNGSSSIGRIDQVANQYGCIAPNAIVTYNNYTYFLSRHGLMRYDNNVFEKSDGAFAYELDLRMRRTDRGIVSPAIRDASIAVNPAYRELYLNIPSYPTDKAGFDRNSENMKGHIYVLNLDTGMATKFQYETGDYERFVPAENPNFPTTRGTHARSLGRIYYTNSYGQLWSGDILPKHKDVVPQADPNFPQYGGYLRSLIYLESPTNRDYDEYQPGIQAMSDSDPGTPAHREEISTQEINTWWRSKVFTNDDKTIIKRVRKVLAYIAEGRSPIIGAEFLNNEYLRDAYTEAQYTVDGELQLIPPRREPGFDRGERFAFHVANTGATEFQNLSFYFRAVNKWVR